MPKPSFAYTVLKIASATTYTYTHEGDYGTTLEFTVEAIGNEEYSTESSPVQVKFRKIKPIAITDLKSSIIGGKIKLSWKAKGIRENENPVYDVAIYARSDYGNPSATPVSALTSDKTDVVLPIETSKKYVVEVVAVLEGYFGPPSTLNITVLDPNSSPTNVLLTFKSPESVTISFTVPPQMNPDIEDEGCERGEECWEAQSWKSGYCASDPTFSAKSVNLCPSQALSESCNKKLVTQDLSSASFNVKHSERLCEVDQNIIVWEGEEWSVRPSGCCVTRYDGFKSQFGGVYMFLISDERRAKAVFLFVGVPSSPQAAFIVHDCDCV
ncbi:unnamed protein product [Haemonchus placei]|uniref:Fibronectin type-III domain-containing protein n=1 Tax=Haemonchus placei TaxID=6290 RepID=A0A158QNH5_HAEPC|nr:unnamed protein product [Haemonchus placei]